MRVIVLLCLLMHADFGQTKFSWYRPEEEVMTPDHRPGSACIAEKSYCRCCLMFQEMTRLRSYFNTTLNELQEVYEQTNQTFNNIRASRTALSVALYGDDDPFQCFGPFGVDTVVTYEHVFLNLGNGYNSGNGIFTVPHSGVYSLALTIYSDAGASGNTLAACAGLQVNGQELAGSTDQNRNDQEDSSSIVIAVRLKAGDQVAVNLPRGCFLCDDNNHYNTFSAFLLYVE